MNLLAHAFLGFDHDQLVVGQLAGDFIKGRDLSALPPMLAGGVRMHRQLDVWTDRHPVFRRSCARINPARRRVAGILVDILYDYSLARGWSAYGCTDLPEFAGFVYARLAQHAALLPASMQGFIRGAGDVGLFENYRTEQGIERAINHVQRRLRRSGGLLDGAFDEIMPLVPAIDRDFDAFFPAAVRACAGWVPDVHSPSLYGDSRPLQETPLFRRTTDDVGPR
ncbi:ACP phosphodiesterase [Granulosicoccaceae sp. 1_MG-2023]|nr:ACP phosphodiesterase [Granulosicoccaceae sp. 1_MG-2023]